MYLHSYSSVANRANAEYRDHVTNKKSTAEHQEGIEAWVFGLVLGLVGDTVMARMLTGVVLEMELGKLNKLYVSCRSTHLPGAENRGKHRIDKALGIPIQNIENEHITDLDIVYTNDAASKGHGTVANGAELSLLNGTWKWGLSTTGYLLVFCSYVTVVVTCDTWIIGVFTSIWLMFLLARSQFFQALTEKHECG